jgi:hypothetical protein
MVRRIEFLTALVILVAAQALAQAPDPPSRVARLNYETGPVSFRPGSLDDWTAASPNYPLTSGDHLWADRGAQAEVHVGSTAIRMNAETALSFLNLDDRNVQLSLTAGAIHVRIRNLRDDESFEVDTPNVAVSLLRPGDYRIQADGDNAVTLVAVEGGEAELTGGGSAFPLHPRQAARITGTDSPASDLIDVPPLDDFDRWSQDRDRREEQVQSVRYVPREMIGYEDLDDYGVWREVPTYGWVWAPTRVVAGWAPYRYGHWAWVAPWGWTWVDDAAWGFAPFHYGRWAFVAGGWVWLPGRVVQRPVYAPALVAFVGGPGFNLSLSVGGGGGVAWFPLGPGEVYRPAYRVSDVYVRNINVTHVNVTNINVTNVNVTNVRYVNQNVAGAMTAVPQQTFASARPVAQAATVVTPQQAAQAQVVGTTAAVAPRPESVVARPVGNAAVVRPPAQVMAHTVVAKATPPPPPVAFRAQQQALQANQGRPLDTNTLDTLRRSPGAAAAPVPVRNALPPRATTAPVATPNAPPARLFDAPRNAGPAPAPPPAEPQPERRPITNDRPVRNDRPAPAAAPPAFNPPPRATPPEPQPERRPITNDRPAPAAPPAFNPPPRATPPEPQPERRPITNDRPVRNDRPAPAAEERKGERKADRPARKEERKEDR